MSVVGADWQNYRPLLYVSTVYRATGLERSSELIKEYVWGEVWRTAGETLDIPLNVLFFAAVHPVLLLLKVLPTYLTEAIKIQKVIYPRTVFTL